jgi:DNA mismatch repair protein MutH
MWTPPVGPPPSEAALLERAVQLSGWQLGELAPRMGQRVPPDLRRHKGWVGQLLELLLGATAGSRPVPDFPELGVELKTLPVDVRGKPAQSTFVCTAPLDRVAASWQESWVQHKLSRVLWVPIVGAGPVGERVVGSPVFWSPDAEEDAVLRADWLELSGLLAAGAYGQIAGGRGVALQLRPKGADASKLAWALDESAEWVRAMPRAWYLRPSFTGAMLARRTHVSALR